MNSRHKSPGNRALGFFKEQQGSQCDWSTVSSKDSEADKVLEVTGNSYRSWRTVGHGRDSGLPLNDKGSYYRCLSRQIT